MKNKKMFIILAIVLVVVLISFVYTYRYTVTHPDIILDNTEIQNGVAKFSLSYDDPTNDKDFLSKCSLFAIKAMKSLHENNGVDAAEFTFYTWFIDGETGQKEKDVGMRFALNYVDVANIDEEGFETLLYKNSMQLQEITNVIVHPAISKGAS